MKQTISNNIHYNVDNRPSAGQVGHHWTVEAAVVADATVDDDAP
jgi:hypothetical protein